MQQIGGYVTYKEKADFKAYSKSFGIAESALANLLVRRELSEPRLSTLREFYPGDASKGPRITANVGDEDIKRRFNAHAKRCGVEPDPAATILWRAELDERWLRCTIFGNQFDSSKSA